MNLRNNYEMDKMWHCQMSIDKKSKKFDYIYVSLS